MGENEGEIKKKDLRRYLGGGRPSWPKKSVKGRQSGGSETEPLKEGGGRKAQQPRNSVRKRKEKNKMRLLGMDSYNLVSAKPEMRARQE